MGCPATQACAPGTSAGKSSLPQSWKNLLSSCFCASVRTVKRGSGSRLLPPIVGGNRQTPPRPERNLETSFSVNSKSPYGGSVQTACSECDWRSRSQSKQSAWKIWYITLSSIFQLFPVRVQQP